MIACNVVAPVSGCRHLQKHVCCQLREQGVLVQGQRSHSDFKRLQLRAPDIAGREDRLVVDRDSNHARQTG